MKDNLRNLKKKTQPKTRDYDEGHHVVNKIRTHEQRKANNALDKALKRASLKDIYTMDDY